MIEHLTYDDSEEVVLQTQMENILETGEVQEQFVDELDLKVEEESVQKVDEVVIKKEVSFF